MHPLDGPRLKIRRAEGQIKRLAAAEEIFKARSNYEIVLAEYDAKRGDYALRILIDIVPSLDWAICIGEIAHNLRSALDNLIYQLALLNPKVQTPARNIQFPIFTVGRSKCRRRRRRRKSGRPSFVRQFAIDGRDMIRDLRPEHKAAIEWLQPYHRRHWGLTGWNTNPLYLLSEINNADKHRLVQVVGANPNTYITSYSTDLSTVRYYFRWNPRLKSGHRRGGRPIPKDGAKVGAIRASVLDKVKVEPRLIPSVAFGNGCQAAEGWGVVLTLSQMAAYTSEVIESFTPEFDGH